LTIKNSHTDNCKVYAKIPKRYNHTTTKDKTTQVESFNARLRHFLPFLHRKTKNYAKSIELIIKKLEVFIFLHNKNIKKYLDYQNFFSTFVNEKKNL